MSNTAVTITIKTFLNYFNCLVTLEERFNPIEL